ncbi:hypothetical protein GC163_24185 [bacterium]|nr:hypothetical protein [bacterium]
MSANIYEVVIKRCKALEQQLEYQWGATGKGLHERVSSIETRLPRPLVRKLRFIATVRNCVVHGSEDPWDLDLEDYQLACDLAEQELDQLVPPPRTIPDIKSPPISASAAPESESGAGCRYGCLVLILLWILVAILGENARRQ